MSYRVTKYCKFCVFIHRIHPQKLIINFNKIRGIPVLLTKIGPNQFILYWYMHNIPLYVFSFLFFFFFFLQTILEKVKFQIFFIYIGAPMYIKKNQQIHFFGIFGFKIICFSNRPPKGVYYAYMDQIWTDLDFFF